MSTQFSVHIASQRLWQGHRMMRDGRPEDAEGFYREAVRAYTAVDRPKNVAEALVALARAYEATGRRGEAVDSLERALTQARAAGAPGMELEAHETLGGLYRQRGDQVQALAHLSQAMTLAEAQGDRERLGSTRLGLAALHHDRAEHELALAFARKALADGLSDARAPLEVAALLELAAILQEVGPIQEAGLRWEEAVARADDEGMELEAALARLGLGGYHLETGAVLKARAPLEQAAGTFGLLGQTTLEAEAMARLAVMTLGVDNLPRAEQHLARASELARGSAVEEELLAVYAAHLDLARGRLAFARFDMTGAESSWGVVRQCLTAASVVLSGSSRGRFALRLLRRSAEDAGVVG